MNAFWLIPTHGDTRYPGRARGARVVTYDYARQIAEAADQLGYEGVLLPTGRSCEDAWVVASSLIPATRRLRFVVAIRPGLASPGLAARMAATFDRLSHGRLLLNVVTSGDPVELAGDGVHLSPDERYALTGEFLHIVRGLLAGKAVTYEGKHLQVRGAKLLYPPVSTPHPPVWFGGSSPVAHELAAAQADTYLAWGESPAAVAERIADVRARATRRGRTLRFGIRLHVIVRDTDDAAWRAADDLIGHLDHQIIAKVQATFGRTDTEGHWHRTARRGGRSDRLEISPNLWAGVGLVPGGAGTALVGDPETVAARMREYADLGIDTFVLSGYPHLEEAYRFAELVFPLLPRERAGAALAGPTLNGPFGELVTDDRYPVAPTLKTVA